MLVVQMAPRWVERLVAPMAEMKVESWADYLAENLETTLAATTVGSKVAMWAKQRAANSVDYLVAQKAAKKALQSVEVTVDLLALQMAVLLEHDLVD